MKSADSIFAGFPLPVFARRIYGILKRIPLVGTLLQRVVRRAIPPGTRAWHVIPAGMGKGLWLHLNSRYEMDYAAAGYEQAIQEELISRLQSGSVFYDVGAHIGLLSMVAARVVGDRGRVFAFEADPDNARQIEEHIRRNLLGQITVLPVAVWSSTGPQRFARASPLSSRNQGAVASDAISDSENIIEVPATTLDQFTRTNPPPTLVKIDVEGSEADVLEGAVRTFADFRPDLICEVHHEMALKSVVAWLTERSYGFRWLRDSPKFPRHLIATPPR